MKDTEIINFYNNLDQYAKDKIDRQIEIRFDRS